MQQLLRVLLLSACATLVAFSSFAKEIQGKDDQGRDYWVYTPDRVDPDKTYTLVVGVHGYRGNGSGAGGYAGWVNKHDVIVLGPTYDSNGYQYLQQGSDQQTLDLVKQLRKEYKLNEKIFIAGFSGGSQYAHRFAMKYPDLVAGCAAHSGGTWATGDYPRNEQPNPKARGVLFVISCGEKDTAKSFPQAPLGRLDWAKRYEKMLEEGGFIYDAQYWPGIGHSPSKGSRQQTLDCFIASTKLLPELADEAERIKQVLHKEDYRGAWMMIRKRQREAARQPEGILRKVHDQYLLSLEPSIESIDRWAKRRVAQAVREHQDDQQRFAELRKLKADYKGLPQTITAIESELDKLR